MKKFFIRIIIVILFLFFGFSIGYYVSQNYNEKQVKTLNLGIKTTKNVIKDKKIDISLLKYTLQYKTDNLTNTNDSYSSHKIDVEEKQCIINAKTDNERNNCKYIAGRKWKKETDIYFKKIIELITDREIKKIPPEDTDYDEFDDPWYSIRENSSCGIHDIKESQVLWGKRINADFALINHILNKDTNSKTKNFAAEEYRNIYKNRAQFLTEIYNVYTGEW